MDFFSYNTFAGGGYACAEHDSALVRGEEAPIDRAAEEVTRQIESCDAVIVGAGAGLSTAAGLTYSGERFDENFADFRDAYGFDDMYSGGFCPFPDLETFWAYWSRYIFINRYENEANDLYVRLRKLVEGKDYFVLTTNVDHQFQLAGFDKSRLFYTQGDFGLFQCSGPCTQETYDNEATIRAMVEQQAGMRVPSELLPACPRCGRPMTTNLRADGTFVEDAGWHKAAERYWAFCKRVQGRRVLYLELGVGGNTPVIVKYPFWEAVGKNDSATYVCINLNEACAPKAINGRSILVKSDIACFFEEHMAAD